MAGKTNGKTGSDAKGEGDRNGNDVARWIGIGAGIGSAAVAAAVLYANRDWLKSKIDKAGKTSPRAEEAQD